MFDGLLHAVLGFVSRYGYVAVFVYMALETGFVLHYVPSEVVVPVAAAELVHDPLSFLLFVLDATAGATVGSLLAYGLFGRYGRGVVERYGHLIHVSERGLERSETAFARYGESAVFWGRLLPFLRAFVSIPAGLAGMDLRRFALYSAAGALLYDTALTYLVYTGAGTASPLALLVAAARGALAPDLAYLRAHVVLAAVLASVVAAVVVAAWLSRDWLRANPEVAKRVTLHVVRLVGVLVGTAFVLGAVSAPAYAFRAVTDVWNDPLFWVHLGFSERVALLLTGVFVALVGVFVYEVGKLVEFVRVRALLDRIAGRP